MQKELGDIRNQEKCRKWIYRNLLFRTTVVDVKTFIESVRNLKQQGYYQDDRNILLLQTHVKYAWEKNYKKAVGLKPWDSIRPAEYNNTFISAFIDMWSSYQKKLQHIAVMDMEDCLSLANIALQIPEVRARCRNRFKFGLVDEFQDCNQMQLNFLSSMQLDYTTVVGDPDQVRRLS